VGYNGHASSAKWHWGKSAAVNGQLSLDLLEIIGYVTELVLVLCGAIVKTAFKLWAGGNVFADEVSGDLTDMVKSQVSGALEQRKVRARFEKMEEIVADQVLALFSSEFRNLDEGEKNAAILAVTETFERARLTDRALFAVNLDSLYLANHVRKFTGDTTRDLSFAGVQLYDRLLRQCCAYIIEIADKLPRFQIGAFAELLNRDAQILARLTEVLERLPTPTSGRGSEDRVETAYRQLIAKRFDRLELFGLDFAAQWYALSIAYVNLTLSGGWDAGDAGDGEQISRSGMFEDWLARYPRLLIEGRAGGGKTTILQWIAVQAARRDFVGAAAGFNGYVPFFLRLREYAEDTLPQPEQFLDKVASLLAPEAGAWPREQIRSGRALVLIDGVDEVPETRRPLVLAWLRELCELFPNVRYVVTTRPSALDDDALSDLGFVQANLEPMDPRLVRVFVDRWHVAMRDWHKDDDSLARLDNCRIELLKTLSYDRFLSELANTPLLAGLICALNYHLGAQLPRRRGEIFEKALAMFHERDRKRGIAGDLTLDLDATNLLLGDLALWMVRNARVEVAARGLIAADSARTILRQSALSLPTRPPETADLYRHLLLRSGVIREPAEDQVDFVHRTFQEYLAAKALIRTDNVGEIVKNATDDQWREVVVIAAGLGITRQTTDLLRGLLRPTWRGNGRYRRRLLAVACLDEIRNADPGVLADVNRIIPELLPPHDMNQAEALSHAGERLIPHLSEALPLVVDARLLPSLRAAALIGGPDALSLVERMARLALGPTAPKIPSFLKGALITEVERAWSYFDPERYAEIIVNEFLYGYVTVRDPQVLRGIAKAPRLKHIILSEVIDGSDFSGLDNALIDSLEITASAIESLVGILGDWLSVQTFRLAHCPVLRDLSSLRNMGNLSRLEIQRCPCMRDYSDLAHLRNLRRAAFIGQEDLDLAHLRNLSTLESVTISDARQVDLRPLEGARFSIFLRNVDRTIPVRPSGEYNVTII
jgi:NACHT domain